MERILNGELNMVYINNKSHRQICTALYRYLFNITQIIRRFISIRQLHEQVLKAIFYTEFFSEFSLVGVHVKVALNQQPQNVNELEIVQICKNNCCEVQSLDLVW